MVPGQAHEDELDELTGFDPSLVETSAYSLDTCKSVLQSGVFGGLRGIGVYEIRRILSRDRAWDEPDTEADLRTVPMLYVDLELKEDILAKELGPLTTMETFFTWGGWFWAGSAEKRTEVERTLQQPKFPLVVGAEIVVMSYQQLDSNEGLRPLLVLEERDSDKYVHQGYFDNVPMTLDELHVAIASALARPECNPSGKDFVVGGQRSDAGSEAEPAAAGSDIAGDGR